MKWRELPYEQATWEADTFEAPGFDEVIKYYWLHREKMLSETPPRHILKKYPNLKRPEEPKVTPKEKSKKKGAADKSDKIDVSFPFYSSFIN